MFKRALVSASDKSALSEFLTPFVHQGLQVISTGGTSKYLKDNKIPVTEVSEQTGFPEVMDGRVRTLHPRIHMPLLARSYDQDDMQLLEKENLQAFDLVIVNLYPFADATAQGLKGEELIEYVDIGGPTLLRAAAKSHHRITVICDPNDYAWVAEKAAKRTLDADDRARLAAKVFAHTSVYDAMIARTLAPNDLEKQFLAGTLVQQLRYGENPQQSAAWMRMPGQSGLHDAEILQGKPLSFNNILDLEAAVKTVRGLLPKENHSHSDVVAVAVKHNNPCGVGLAPTVSESVGRALTADPVSVFGGIIAVNAVIDQAAAEQLAKLFLECVVAFDFSIEARGILQKKKDLRLLRWPKLLENEGSVEWRSVDGGYLIQTRDHVDAWSDQWQVVGPMENKKICEEMKRDLQFAWAVCAQLKSNAIAIAKSNQTLGLGMGQVNRVEAVEHAIARMQAHHPSARDVVLASDAFFPFPDSIEMIAKAGIHWVIQPGGSIRDESVFARARELGVNLVLTGKRHFRH